MTLDWYGLSFPSELTDEAVLGFTRSLSMRKRSGPAGWAEPVVLLVSGDTTALHWHIGVARNERSQVLAALRQHVPGVTTTETAAPALAGHARGVELRLRDARRPLRTDVAGTVSGALLAALQQVERGEQLVLQWIIGPWLHRPIVPPAGSAKETTYPLQQLSAGGQPDSEQARAWRAKQAEPVFGVVGRIAVSAPRRERQRQLVQGILGALQVVREPGAGFVRRLLPGEWVPNRLTRLQRPWFAWPCVLSASELVSVIGWPVGNPALPGVTYHGHRQLPPPSLALHHASDPTVAPPKGWRVTGWATYPGQQGFLALSPTAALKHLHLIGPTGTGKSTAIARLALGDIAAGRGVVLIDPKGDLVDAVLTRIEPKDQGRVVILDPTDTKRPVGWNVLAAPADEQEIVVDGVLHVLRELYAAHWGPRTQDILHAGLLTLTRSGDYTLAELPVLLTNAPFRAQLVAKVRQDPFGLGSFWQWFEHLSEAERAAVLGPVLNKLRGFTLRMPLRLTLGQQPGLDLTTVFTERRVLLVPLNSGRLGPETAHLFGALLLSSLWRIVQRRATIPEAKRHPVMVYLDEFQDYLRLPLALSDVLAQARGYGVGLTLAHQHLGQLDAGVRAAVLANARSRIVFQCSPEDARALAPHMGSGLTSEDLVALGAFETYQRLVVGNGVSAAASAISLPLPEPRGDGRTLREASRQAFGRDRADVEAALLARRQADVDVEGPVGHRRRDRGGS